MNNTDYLNNDGRQKEVRYDPVASDDRTLSLEPERDEKPPREGSTHVAKLASLTGLFALMLVVGGLTFVVNNRSQTTGTRASIEVPSGPAAISAEDKALTTSVTEYPVKYKDRPIPANLMSEGNSKYISIAEEERKAYVINRIVLFYIYSDVLSTNNVSFTRPSQPLTFTGIEQSMIELSATMKREYPEQYQIFVTEYLSRFGY